MKAGANPEYFIMWRMLFKGGRKSEWMVEQKSFAVWKEVKEKRQEIADEFPCTEVIITGKFEE